MTGDARTEELDRVAEVERRVGKIWHVSPGVEAQSDRLDAGVERGGRFTCADQR